MKYLPLIACFVFFTSNISPLFSQKNARYPVTIADMNVAGPPGIPRMLLSGKAIDYDYYVITLRIDDRANMRQEGIVRPFTQENFSRVLRTLYKELLEDYEKESGSEPDKVGLSPSLELNPSTNRDNYIGNSTISATTAHEKELYFQMKGSEVVTPAGSEKPVAGEICFTSDFLVVSELDAFNKKKYKSDSKNYIQKKWNEYCRQTGRDSTDKIPAASKKALENAFEEEYKRSKSTEFEAKRKKFIEKESQLDKAKFTLSEKRWSMYYQYDSLFGAINKDLSITDSLRRGFLRAVKQAYRNDTKMEELAMKPGERNLLVTNENCKKMAAYLAWRAVERLKPEKLEDEIKLLEKELNIATKDLLLGVTEKYVKFTVEYAEMEFNEGFIENIMVVGKVWTFDFSKTYDEDDARNTAWGVEEAKSKRIKFENKFPIGFSRKSDYKSLSQVKLYSTGKNGEEDFTMVLGDLLNIYLPKLEVGRRDYSPANGIVIYDPKESSGCITLHKEATSKLFEARVYSDFVGLDENSANGLIQTEIAKRLNINTGRVRNSRFIGGFGWIEPVVTLSKIEENNRDLSLDQQAPVATSNRVQYLSATLDIRQHEALNIGTRLNLVYCDLPRYKTTFFLNPGIYYGRTPVTSALNQPGLNTFTFSTELAADIKADERWGLHLMYRLNSMNILSRDFIQVADVTDPLNTLRKDIRENWYSTAQFSVFFQPSEENRGKLFFRYRYHWQWGDWNLGFHQAQIGYSFYLLGRNKGAE